MTWIKETSTWLLAGIVVLIVGLAFAFMAVFGVGFFQRTTAGFRGGTSAIEKTKGNGSFRIASYDAFFNLCNAVKAQEEKIPIAEKNVALFKGTDNEATAVANLSAIASERVTLINSYNAKAAGTATAGQFRASSLPFQIDPNQEVTQCN